MIRGSRVPRERDLSIAAEVRALASAAGAGARGKERVEAAWASVAPASVARVGRIGAVTGGVVTVVCASAAERFVVDRWLRGGGEAALARACGMVIRRVRVSAPGR